MTADEFNAAHPIGTPVLAFPGTRDGRALRTRTRTPAWTVGEHAVVSVEGYAGGIALTHIEIIEEAPATEQQTDQQEVELDSWMTRAYEAEKRAWQAEKRLAGWMEHWNATTRTGAVDEVAAILEANARADHAEARIAEEKHLRMKATAAATKAEARIKAVQDVLDTWMTYCQTEQTARALSDIRRALNGYTET